MATSFTLNFDAAKLRNPVVTLRSGAPVDTILTTNTREAAAGHITVLVDSGSALAKQFVNIAFDVAENSPAGETRMTFADDPTPSSISDAAGQRLVANYEDGIVTISGANASGFVISGRVLMPDGRGLRNTSVSITDSNGIARTVTTSSFGYYSFEGVSGGQRYVIGVASRQYRFASRTVEVTDNLTDLDFVAQE